ncbi:MAG: nucleotidyltransferase family protein [Flavobacteriales bacterium]|nr:nucleotidyltransferase family protein [Flavobacteriales bacterium]
MTYKEGLYFIGAILSLSQHPERKESLKEQLASGALNWDKLVQISSGHMVFQALYLNLQRADLLEYLPKALVNYAAALTQLNRNRNNAIIKQAKSLQDLLSKHGITPIFLKGTAHLLENLYQDIGERLVGDIDFLVDPEQIVQTAEILRTNGYEPKGVFIPNEQQHSKHYPRLVHPDKIAALEIHWAVIANPYQDTLTYQDIYKDKLLVNGFFVPSYPHQAIHNMMNTQINDSGFLKGKIMMRQFYDGFVLSFKPEVLLALSNFKPVYYRKNGYLKLIQMIFKAGHISVPETKSLTFLMFRYVMSIDFPKSNRFINELIYFSMRFIHYPKTIIQACYKKEVRLYIFRRISNPAWYGQHLRSYKNRT